MSYSKSDRGIVAQAEAERDLMCAADNCPRRWSVQRGGERGLCSAHAWSDPHKWPQVTQDLHDQDLNKARYHEPPTKPKTATREEALKDLRSMRIGNPDPKAWARILESRDQSGENLTALQRKMYQEAL